MLQVSGSTGLWLQNNHKNLKADGLGRLLFVIILPKIDIEFEEILYYKYTLLVHRSAVQAKN